MASVIRSSIASLARRWNSFVEAREQTEAARRFWDEGAPGEPENHYWGAQPLVRRAINRRLTGDPNCWPMEWFAGRFVPETVPLGLSVGCGSGLLERDVLAKNIAVGRDEREVSRVFETIEPFAAELARSGRSPSNRRSMLRTIGQALLVHHRLSGRVEVEEKPDVLWDNPQLERLYARLADEYELKERAGGLARKLRVIDETTRALTDLIDTQRSVRLEVTIVVLILVEVLIALYDIFWRVK